MDQQRSHHFVSRMLETWDGFFRDALTALSFNGISGDYAEFGSHGATTLWLAHRQMAQARPLAYVDCDMYSSTVTALQFLRPRLKHGMIIAFDDYYCWTSSDVSGERAALQEFLVENPEWHFHRYREIGWAGTSFVVERNDHRSRSKEAGRHG